MNGWTVFGWVAGCWVGANAVLFGAVMVGFRRIDRLAADVDPGWLDERDLWAEFDRVAAAKGDVW